MKMRIQRRREDDIKSKMTEIRKREKKENRIRISIKMKKMKRMRKKMMIVKTRIMTTYKDKILHTSPSF